MRYSILTLSIACATENQIIHDGECDSVPNSAEPAVYVNQCPEVNLSCPDIPECPDVNVTCPEPQVVVELISPEPNVNVNVEAPNVTVTNDVEPPDFNDLVDAILLLSAESGSTRDYFAHSININPYTYSSHVLWENTSNDEAIITMIASYEDNLGCHLLDASANTLIENICYAGSCQRGGATHGRHSGYGYDNRLTLPVQPGEYISCGSSDSASVYVQGYYQQ